MYTFKGQSSSEDKEATIKFQEEIEFDLDTVPECNKEFLKKQQDNFLHGKWNMYEMEDGNVVFVINQEDVELIRDESNPNIITNIIPKK